MLPCDHRAATQVDGEGQTGEDENELISDQDVHLPAGQARDGADRQHYADSARGGQRHDATAAHDARRG